MDFEEQMQKEHAVRQFFFEDSGETLRRRRDVVPPLTTRSEQYINERSHEYNINIAIMTLTDYEEVENEFAALIVEIKGANVFPCSNVAKYVNQKAV